jgi:hypothetical protein
MHALQMTTDSIAQNPAPVVVVAVVVILLVVWSTVATARVFQRLGQPAWKAWVPIVNVVTILRAGSMNAAWVITLFLPVVQVAGIVVFYYAIHHITVRLGRGIGTTLIGVVAYPVWATIVGSVVRAPSEPVFEVRMEALQLPVAPVLRVQQAAPHAGLSPVTEPAWTPPPLLPPTVPVAVRKPPVPAPPAPPVEIDEDTDDVFERTVLARRRRTVWRLTPPDGTPIVLTGDTVVLGRRPVASVSDSQTQLVEIADPTRSLSKTHARLELRDGVWFITDLNSTNGIYLVDEGGSETEIAPESPAEAGSEFLLGQLRMTLTARG